MCLCLSNLCTWFFYTCVRQNRNAQFYGVSDESLWNDCMDEAQRRSYAALLPGHSMHGLVHSPTFARLQRMRHDPAPSVSELAR